MNSIIFTNCVYSFYKGNIDYSDFSISKIENNTYNVELTSLLENDIYKIFSEYTNVNIKEKSNNALYITIDKYNRLPVNYDNDGNIILYKYEFTSKYIINDTLTFFINTQKTFDSKIEETECQDSIITENLKSFIDKLRKEF